LHIVVCVKQVPHPETPASQFLIDEVARTVEAMTGVPLVMSPFDEQAVELALRIRDGMPGTTVTLVTLGPERARNVLKHGLAMGADAAILLADPALADSDSHAVALALAAAVRKIGAIDLVLAGRQAADDDCGIVGIGIGECLAAPVVSFAKAVAVADSVVRVERVLDDASEIVEAPLPAVVTVSNEAGEARKPSLRETMRAARKPIVQWTAAELGLAPGALGAAGRRCVVERVYAPVRQPRCEIIPGATPHVQAARLVQRLRTARLL
jgi:electron transfer flavoprotein beta subunit